MEVIGKLVKIGDIETISDKFKKRVVIVETDETYPQKLSIEFINDKTVIFGGYKVGDYVKIGINLRGREWTDKQGVVKYFNSIAGWRIDKADAPVAVETEPSQDDILF